MKRYRSTLAAACILMGACSGAGGSGASDPSPRPVRTLAKPATGPYVSVAVDNHFHDIHPEDDVQIAADRAFVVKNQGRNLHNVRIGGTDIDVDIRPGESFAVDPLGEELDAGVYTVACRFHESMGMVGQFEVVEPEG